MKKFQREIRREEIAGLKVPGYLISTQRGRTPEATEYFKRCIQLLNNEAKKFPGHHIKMRTRNGFPVSFIYFKRSPKDEALVRKINRTLAAAPAKKGQEG